MSTAGMSDTVARICSRIGDLTGDYDIRLQEVLAFDRLCNAKIGDQTRGSETLPLTTQQEKQFEKLVEQTARVRALGFEVVESTTDIELLFRALLSALQSNVDQMRARAAGGYRDDGLVDAGELLIEKISSIMQVSPNCL